MLKYALLGLLQYQPMSGYDLEQFMNTSIVHFWHAKLSQIYRTLKEMEAEGLVTSRFTEQQEHRSKRLYTLTDNGQTVLKEWLSQFDTELDEVKLPFMLRVFFFGGVDKPHIEAQLRLWRDLHQRHLEHYQTAIRPKIQAVTKDTHLSAKDVFFWQATLRFGEMYEDMVLRWFGEISREMDKFET